MKEFTLWAVQKGDPDWAESVVTSTTDTEQLKNAKDWAERNGFDRLRISEFNPNMNIQKAFRRSVRL